jgi:hypothetical protein
VEVWPNPTSGVFSLKSLVFSQGSAVIEILDLNGKTLEHWNPGTLEPWNLEPWNLEPGTRNLGTRNLGTRNPGTLELDISHLPAGIYFIRIGIGNEWIVRKIVKL